MSSRTVIAIGETVMVRYLDSNHFGVVMKGYIKNGYKKYDVLLEKGTYLVGISTSTDEKTFIKPVKKIKSLEDNQKPIAKIDASKYDFTDIAEHSTTLPNIEE